MDSTKLFDSPIFRNIPLEQRGEFLDKLDYKSISYKKGEYIAYQGDTVNALYILLKGKVKTEMVPESGMILSIETISAPNPLAPAFLFAERNRFPVDVIALENSEVMTISKDNVMKLIASNERFLQAYMAFNSNRTIFLSERLRLLTIKTIKGKLSQYILERTKVGEFSTDMNQTQMAEYFGVARPSLSRSLSEMVDEGAITFHRGKGKVLDTELLKNYILQ